MDMIILPIIDPGGKNFQHSLLEENSIHLMLEKLFVKIDVKDV